MAQKLNKPIAAGLGSKCYVTRDNLNNLREVLIDEEIRRMSFYFP